MGKPDFRIAGIIAILLVVATLAVAWTQDLPVRDPDGVVVPMWAWLPAVVLLAMALDVLPAAVLLARRAGRPFVTTLQEVCRARWTRSQFGFMLAGLGAWYACYATFRNLKSYVPFVNTGIHDKDLERIDRALFLGNDPAELLHSLLGTGFMAEVMSFVYVAWIALLPATLAIALVWTRSRARSSWYVTAIAFNWVLGVAVYYLLPTLGPIYSRPQLFDDLPHTYVSTLQEQLLTDRQAVLADPWATTSVQTIAAFASLHVAMCVVMALFATLAGLPRVVRIGSWIFLGVTIVSTVYLGWHFFVDAVGGCLVGGAAIWLAAAATGNLDGLRPRLVSSQPVAESASTSIDA